MYSLTPRSVFVAFTLLSIIVYAADRNQALLHDGHTLPSFSKVGGLSGKCARTADAPANVVGCAKCAQLKERVEVGAMQPFSVSSCPPLDVAPLIVSGASSNRVDLVFFSDGYLPEEKDKFIEDAGRLAQDISGNQTFNSVKPLLNFWAAFSPSNESGIGTGGVPKDTPFGLYRDGTELRGVYYSKPEVARAACDSLGEQCDYPILLGNDPLYGGLGGEFTVITSSLLNGPLVLRHELGHSIIGVGEEYDGGFAYFGVNAVHNASEPVSWEKWLSKKPHDSDSNIKSPRVERSVMPMQAYPWTMLNTTSAWSVKFQSSGTYARHLVRFSLSGLPEKTDLKVELDGVDLNWVPVDIVGLDRWHYDIHVEDALVSGEHELRFTLLNGDREGVAQLCSAEILEFGDENEFVSTPGHYSLYPTYSDANETSYRPTNEDCLMRIVTSPNFCKVCLEGLWFSLLRRVSLIETVTDDCKYLPASETDAGSGTGSGAWVKTINVGLIPLAHLRENELATMESYTITWKRAGKLLKEFTNMTRIEVDNEFAVAQYTISVEFATEEIREESDLLKSSVSYNVFEKCGP